jgi:Family of unknown function (DUF6116)
MVKIPRNQGVPCMLKSLIAPFVAYAAKLRFPTLFKITAALFVLNVMIPDIMPFADEILLGLGTALLAAFKKRKEPVVETPVDASKNAAD